MPWTRDPLAPSTQLSHHFLAPSGHYEPGPYAQSAQIQYSTYAFGGLDKGFVRPPHTDAQLFNNVHQDANILNSLPMLQSENGAHRALAVDFRSNHTAGLEAFSVEAFPQGMPEGSVPNIYVRSGNAHGVQLELDNQHQFEAAPQRTLCGSRKRKRRRDSNWTKEETSTLVDLKEEAMREKGSRFCKGKPTATNWEAISAEMKNKLGTTAPAKSGDQCRLRWDTLMKSYQKISLHCVRSNKEFSELKEEERGELRLATTLSEDRWYEVIDKFCRPRSRKAKAQQRNDLTAVVNGRCSVSQQNSFLDMKHNCELAGISYCEKQVAIPGFKTLSITRRSTLLDLVNGSIILADVPWVSFLLIVKEICQWLSIVQNRSPSNVNWDVCSLVKKKLVRKDSA